MDSDPLQLRVIVDNCRQLRLRISHPETVTRLTALAETYERKLQRFQSSSERKRGPRGKPQSRS